MAGFAVLTGVPVASLTTTLPKATQPSRDVSAGPPWDGNPVPYMGAGTLADARPVPIRGYQWRAVHARSYFNDFYDRIYFLPPVVDFKAISGPTTQTLVIWNAYLDPVVITGVLAKNDDGVAISGPDLPRNMRGLEALTYTLTATAVGAPSVAVDYTFKFETPGGAQLTTPIVQAIGNRARFLPYRPQWTDPYVVQYQFKTDITVSRSGMEQRRRVRSTPDKTISYKVRILDLTSVRYLDNLFTVWRAKQFVLPELSRMVLMESPMPSGGKQTTVRAIPEWMVERSTVALYNGGKISLRTVLSVNKDTGAIVFAEGDDSRWKIGDWICCTQVGFLDEDQDSQFLMQGARDLTMKFNVWQGRDIPEPYGTPNSNFQGLEVWGFPPDGKDGMQITFQNPAEDVYFGWGNLERFTPIDYPHRTIAATYLQLDREKSDLMRQFWLRQEGMRGEFWFPSYSDDLGPIDDLLQGAADIRIPNQDTFDIANGSDVFVAIQIHVRGGDRLNYLVNAVERINDERGKDTVIKIAGNFPYDIPLDRLMKVSWLFRARFANDVFAQEWLNLDYSKVKLTIQTLRALPGN